MRSCSSSSTASMSDECCIRLREGYKKLEEELEAKVCSGHGSVKKASDAMLFMDKSWMFVCE